MRPQAKRLEYALLIIYGCIFCCCFVDIAICLYYLSALSLDSFQTSSVFSGILLTATGVIICSIWGCHRTKDARKLLPQRSKQNTFSQIFFLSVFFVILIIFVILTAGTHEVYSTLAEIESEPWGYWDDHPGDEQDMLMNFAIEFNDMWVDGGCSGNECSYNNCTGDPIVMTALKCIDVSMEIQFADWIGTYSGGADGLRTCIRVVDQVMIEADIQNYPTPTWCQCRAYFIDSAREANETMFIFLIIQCALVATTIPLVLIHTKYVRKSKPVSRIDWFSERAPLT